VIEFSAHHSGHVLLKPVYDTDGTDNTHREGTADPLREMSSCRRYIETINFSRREAVRRTSPAPRRHMSRKCIRAGSHLKTSVDPVKKQTKYVVDAYGVQVLLILASTGPQDYRAHSVLLNTVGIIIHT